MASREKQGFYYFFITITAVFALFLLIKTILIVTSGTKKITGYENPVVADQVIRGTIYDRNGEILAMETPYYSCAILLQRIDDLPKAAQVIAPYLGMLPEDILNTASNYTTYAMIKRKIDPQLVEPLRQVIQESGLYEGVLIEKKYGRTYPRLFHASQIVGFTNTENVGLEGVELAWESLLSPYPELEAELTYGNDVYLTLDMDIQYLLDLQLQTISQTHITDYVLGVIMDAKNGEILASATYPWFDPNTYTSSTVSERQNRLITYMYEPGSVFKIYSLAAVLEAGQAHTNEPFTCTGSYTFTMPGGSTATINCVSPHGVLDPAGMVKHSCNGAIVHWALQTDDITFANLLMKMGFGQAWDIGMPGSIKGLFPQVSAWSGRTKATLSFGQEIGVNALQMTSAATIFANEGNLIAPRILLKVTDHDGTVITKTERQEVTHVIDAQLASDILSYMITATQSGGTAVRAAVSGIDVAAKTGTAQILNPLTNSYEDGSVMASTLVLVPAHDPKYIIYLAAANPRGSTIWGSNIAAPAIAEIIKGLMSQGKLTSQASPVIPIPTL